MLTSVLQIVCRVHDFKTMATVDVKQRKCVLRITVTFNRREGTGLYEGEMRTKNNIHVAWRRVPGKRPSSPQKWSSLGVVLIFHLSIFASF